MSILTNRPQRLECAPTRSSVSTATTEVDRHGEADYPEDQVVEHGRDWVFLRHQEESANGDREAFLQEIRSRCAQARRLQGNEDQVAGPIAGRVRSAREG